METVRETGEMNEKTVDQLNELLRGELSAVETYGQALEKVGGETGIRAQLEENRASHQRRVQLLREAIFQRGGQPSEGSGAWGAFARLVEGAAKAFGLEQAIAALEEGEDHGLKQYRENLDELDPAARALVVDELLAEQIRSHEIMSNLKHSYAHH